MKHLGSLLSLLSLLAGLGLPGCKEDPVIEPGPVWTPDETYRSPGAEGPFGERGLLDLRGVIHSHSPYSHDACDGEPRDPTTNTIDELCFDDLRQAICQTRHDFMMLTDHGDSFAETEFPEVLLYREALGDELIERGGGPVANRISCEGESTLVLAGTETGAMPVGLEGHVSADPIERRRVYGSTLSADFDLMKAQGAVMLAQHTEDWSDDDLVDLPFDGFEMFNVHANLFLNVGKALELITMLDTPEELPHPEVILAILISEDPTYLGRWSRVLARGTHRVTTLATDSHRNTFRDLLPDGERIDSFRRLMRMFGNHLLVRPAADGQWNDRDLKDALRTGRLYGSFDFLGFPKGFDFHALTAGALREMGESAPVPGTELVVVAPEVQNLDPELPAPEITLRLLRASADGWIEEATGSGELRFTPTEPGAYRAEVRMRPYHLQGFLGSFDYLAEEEDYVWVYANPIYLEL